MPEQKSQTRLWPAVFISAIILAALMVWAVVKQPGTRATGPEPRATSDKPRTTNNEIRKIRLNDVIKAARTWQPAYTYWFGQKAPDFTLTDINGKQHKLSDYRGKNVMIIFWATWCPPCRMEVPHLTTLRNTISEDKLAMLAISYVTTMPRETTEIVKSFAERNKINYTVFSSDVSTMPIPFNTVTSIPCSFFIDPDGKIKLATEGLLSLGEIKAILQAK